MEFSRPSPSRPSEPALPMINVVFLLLIFFLMSAQISAPPPFDVVPPAGDGPENAQAEHILYISAGGDLAYRDSRGPAVWDALAPLAETEEATILIRADAGLPAAEVAEALARLTALGLGNIRLAMAPR